MDTQDRRSTPRVNMELFGWYKPAGSEEQFATVIVMNVSDKGICLLANSELPIGSTLHLCLNLEHLGLVNVVVEVIYTDRVGPEQWRTGLKVVQYHLQDEEKLLLFYCQNMSGKPARKKILIVEDQRDMAKLLKMELEDEYDVFCAYDGQEGLAEYQKLKPDLILLDLGLPKMNGMEVCRSIRRTHNDTKTIILMLTAKRDDVDRIRGKVLGAENYFTKPFEMQDLSREIRRLIHMTGAREKAEG